MIVKCFTQCLARKCSVKRHLLLSESSEPVTKETQMPPLQRPSLAGAKVGKRFKNRFIEV